MAETYRVRITEQNGHTVIVLPEGVRLARGEATMFRNDDTGDLVVSVRSQRERWADFVRFRDSLPFSEADWDDFQQDMEGIIEERRRDVPEPRDPFGDPE
jgi:hypothetical protein